MVMGQWSKLSVNILELIYKICSLCVPWNSNHSKMLNNKDIRSLRASRNSLSKMSNHQVRRSPILLLHALDSDNVESHGLFHPIEKKVYRLDLPDARGMFFKGSSHGWVATVEDDDIGPAIYLLNPFTRARIQLPPRNMFPDVVDYRPHEIGREYALIFPSGGIGLQYLGSAHVNMHFLDKVVFSSSPSNIDCVVVAIYGECGGLAYCKCNDKKWSLLPPSDCYSDVIFHKGKLHALLSDGSLLVFESIGPNPEVKQIAAAPDVICYLYLVKSSDDGLFMVVRDLEQRSDDDDDNDNEGACFPFTHHFDVYKHDPNNSSWMAVRNIGDEVFFIGGNSSLSVRSHEFPGYGKNCIYFTDNLSDFFDKAIGGGADIGVFYLEDERVESLPGFKCNPKLVWPPPIWVTPSFD